MPERTSYAPGTPSWVDIGVPDTAVAAAFYSGLFGWTATPDPRPEAGGYGMFTIGGKNVGGYGPQMNDDMPPSWSVYVSVADADGTAAIATANGGNVVVEPMDVFDLGRFGVIQDPNGSFISIWQPIQHHGAEIVNEPNTFVWNELATADMGVTIAFYRAIFGWQTDDYDESKVFLVDGQMVCGTHTVGDGEFPAWTAWFAVSDCDASAATVTELGGSVIVPPGDQSFGRGAVVADPAGAVFGIATIS
jgi:predicted enzyme related to lactoylglutathione lyase